MINLATPDDLSQIQQILNKPENLDKLEGYPDQAVLDAITSDNARVLVWKEAGSWSGFCWLSVSDAGTKIEEFGVTAPGEGIGARFFKAILEDFRSTKLPAPLWLIVAGDNRGAFRFYERFGFVTFEVNKAAWKRRKGPVADAVKMRWQNPSPDLGAVSGGQ